MVRRAHDDTDPGHPDFVRPLEAEETVELSVAFFVWLPYALQANQ